MSNNLKLLIKDAVKRCTKCGIVHRVDNFNKARHHKDGLKSQCKGCESAWHAKKYKEDGKKKAKNAEWSKANPNWRKNWQKMDMQENPEKWRNWRLKRTFGITIDQYNQMFSDQNGCCAICSRHQSEVTQTLCVDHNHKTGKIRKLLCGPCNHAIGLIRENKKTALSMASYLENDE